MEAIDSTSSNATMQPPGDSGSGAVLDEPDVADDSGGGQTDNEGLDIVQRHPSMFHNLTCSQPPVGRAGPARVAQGLGTTIS